MLAQLKNVSVDTWARTICFGLALINQILALAGKGQIEFVENDIYQIVTLLATLVTGIAAWWKNNSFTTAAQVGDKAMADYKSSVE